MAKIKYLGIYSGYSYFGMDFERMAGFTSLAEAKGYFNSFYDGAVWFDEYRENGDGNYVKWEDSAYSLTPCTTREDALDVYGVEEVEPGVYARHLEGSYRFTFSERGGIKRESF